MMAVSCNTRATACSLAALAVFENEDDRAWENWTACSLANTELRIGHLELGTRQLLAAMDAFRTIGWRDYELGAATYLADSACLRENFEEAAAWLAEAGDGSSIKGGEEFRPQLLTIGGDVHAALGASAKARSCYEEAIKAHLAQNRPVAALDPQAGLARLALTNGDAMQARAHIDDAIKRVDSGWRTGLVRDPLRIMLTCHEVLAASRDARAGELLLLAHTSLQARANLLAAVDRDAFLRNVPTNRAIVAAWEEWQRAGAK
jgi:tetratricopeptide (TPR) repeat protein